MRWRHPELGLVSPMQFIPLAEETGLIVPIDYWVLHRSCQTMRGWQDRELVDPAFEELDTLALKPRKTDIEIRLLALAWAPYRVKDGVGEPGW